MKLTTLCYIEKDDSYLMLHRVKKQEDANRGKWIGVGGKQKQGESPEACMLREVKEETGLTLVEYELRGVISFVSDCWEDEYMYLYTASKFSGELTECNEGELEWINKERLMELNLWQGDRLFLELLLEDSKFFTMVLSYHGEELEEWSVKFPEIKNIILDMGNVLIDFKPENALEEYFPEEERELIKTELFEGAEWIHADLGLITNKERFCGVSKRIPERLHKKLEDCIEGWQYCSLSLHPGAQEFLGEITAQGFRLFVLSNACDMFHQYFQRYYDLSIFDGILVSSDVTMIKPYVRIYERLLKNFGLEASECLFLDDRAENVKGAIKAGIQAVTFDGSFERVKKYLYNITK